LDVAIGDRVHLIVVEPIKWVIYFDLVDTSAGEFVNLHCEVVRQVTLATISGAISSVVLTSVVNDDIIKVPVRHQNSIRPSACDLVHVIIRVLHGVREVTGIRRARSQLIVVLIDASVVLIDSNFCS
jgi:hypothetical protein